MAFIREFLQEDGDPLKTRRIHFVRVRWAAVGPRGKSFITDIPNNEPYSGLSPDNDLAEVRNCAIFREQFAFKRLLPAFVFSSVPRFVKSSFMLS
jgi:hypothetical protein